MYSTQQTENKSMLMPEQTSLGQTTLEKEKATIEEILTQYNREFHTSPQEKTIDMGLVIKYTDLKAHVTKFVKELKGRSAGFLGLYDDCIQSFISDQCDAGHNSLSETKH